MCSLLNVGGLAASGYVASAVGTDGKELRFFDRSLDLDVASSPNATS